VANSYPLPKNKPRLIAEAIADAGEVEKEEEE